MFLETEAAIPIGAKPNLYWSRGGLVNGKDSFRGRPATENDSILDFRRSQTSDHDEIN